MKCDICDQEFANSEEVKRHKEQAHPMGEEDGKQPERQPDLMETPDETPEPAEQRRR